MKFNLILLVALGAVTIASTQRCNRNEVYKKCCGCDQICNSKRITCKPGCSSPGCYCKDGYIRDFMGGNCIRKEICPGSTGPEIIDPPTNSLGGPDDPVCGANEVYQRCGVGWQCEDYCGRGPNACAYCVNGCYCKKGYIRSGPESSAKCIKENQCPGAQPENPGQSRGCRVNEEYYLCGGCDQYCNREPKFCTQDCSSPGCYCKKGYKRSFEKGICIPDYTCPGARPSGPNQSPGVQCGRNEYYSPCNGCDKYCNGKTVSCTYDCGRPGCYCEKGYKRSFEGACIPANKCPVNVPFGPGPAISPGSQCRENEKYDLCGVGSGCEDYCGRGAFACSYCQPGCYCIDGYIREGPGSSAKCIRKNKCPVNVPFGPGPAISPGAQCGINEVFQSCGVGRGCEKYCGRGNNACARCQPGCYCIKGYIREGPKCTAQCIPHNQCPLSIPLGPGPVISPGDQCGTNEEYQQCGVGRECENYCGRGDDACAYCQPGCYCKKGYIRSGPGKPASCVRETHCSHASPGDSAVAQSTSPACPATEEYRRCGVGWQCEDYCGRGADACAYCEDGCYCQKGYIRVNSNYKSGCIMEDQCPVSEE